jgi:hypothetical protein
MGEVTKAKARRPTSFELRARVVAAIEKFIAGSEREEWHAAFSSYQFRLLIDDEFRVFIAEIAAPTAALFLFSALSESLASILGRSSLAGELRTPRSTLQRNRYWENLNAQNGGCLDLTAAQESFRNRRASKWKRWHAFWW